MPPYRDAPGKYLLAGAAVALFAAVILAAWFSGAIGAQPPECIHSGYIPEVER